MVMDDFREWVILGVFRSIKYCEVLKLRLKEEILNWKAHESSK